MWPISPFFLTRAGSLALPPCKERAYLPGDFLQKAQAEASPPSAWGVALNAVKGSSLVSEMTYYRNRHAGLVRYVA